MPAHFENCEDVVGVLVRFQIEDERRKSENAERGRGEDRAFQAVRGFLAQDRSRRPGGPGEMVWNIVEKTLDAGGRFERAQFPQLGRSEAEWAASGQIRHSERLDQRNHGVSSGAAAASHAGFKTAEFSFRARAIFLR